MSLTEALTRRWTGGRPTRRSAAAARIAPLFHKAFYLQSYPDVAAAGLDPVAHYLDRGWRERRQPHPLFDADWYLSTNEDVADANVEPLQHYLTSGWREGRRPHVLFTPGEYAHRAGLGTTPSENPLLHYIREGWKSGIDPHPLFDVVWYLCRNSGLVAADREPLMHYITEGWMRGLMPHPLFDPRWYLKRHADVASAGVEPLAHYLKDGWRTKRTPSAMFEARPRINHSRPGAVQSPLELYARSPEYRAKEAPPRFDASQYRTLYKAFRDFSDKRALTHYVTTGFSEGRLGASINARKVTAAPPVVAEAPRTGKRPGRFGGVPQYASPLIIAGFHRSGTSMSANILANAGLHVGDQLLGSKPSNPYGHFEDTEIIKFHDRVLEQNGQNWQSVRDYPLALSQADWRFMVSYGTRKSSHQAWGFKDPRVCLFLTEWLEVFPDAAVLYIYRPCVECVFSLKKRAAADYVAGRAQPLNWNFFRPIDTAVHMYLAYARRSLAFMERFRGRLKVVSLEDLLSNRDIVAEIRQDWGYRLADVLPLDVYDGKSLSLHGPNEAIHDTSLIAEIEDVDAQFRARLH